MRILRFMVPALAVLTIVSFGVFMSGPGVTQVRAQEPPTSTPTPTEEPTDEPTEEVTEDPTEEATEEPTEEADDDEDADSAATEDPTEEPTSIPTLSIPTVEPASSSEVSPLPPAGPVTAPSTGDAGLADQGSSPPYALIGLATAAAISGAAFALRRRLR